MKYKITPDEWYFYFIEQNENGIPIPADTAKWIKEVFLDFVLVQEYLGLRVESSPLSLNEQIKAKFKDKNVA